MDEEIGGGDKISDLRRIAMERIPHLQLPLSVDKKGKLKRTLKEAPVGGPR